MIKKALIIGNSDGIGLAITKRLLSEGHSLVGISRSPSSINSTSYKHIVSDVSKENYLTMLKNILGKEAPFDICIYCAGIGELLDLSNLDVEIQVVNVNLLGLVKTVSLVIPSMLAHGKGHFIGLSSFADELLSEEAPSYHASKAGFSSYLESLALALRAEPVTITNLRFGFVKTKMAKGDAFPLMMTTRRAAEYIKKCIDKKPARFTVPKLAIPLVKIRSLMLNMKIKFQ